MSDRTCKYCGAEVRWCRDDGEHWVPLDVAKVPSAEPRAEYVVVGAEDARRIVKANRGRLETLYRRHTCEQGKNARALNKRQSNDRRELETTKRQLAFEQASLPDNVTLLRSHRRRRG